MKPITLCLGLLALLGCETGEPDQCIRQKVFLECVRSIQNVGGKALYIDSAFTVCGQQALALAIRPIDKIPDECRR